MGPFTETKWVVCHGSGAVHFVQVPIGSSVETGQATLEDFTVEATALARALVLGYVVPTEE